MTMAKLLSDIQDPAAHSSNSYFGDASFLAGNGRHRRFKVSNLAWTPLSQYAYATNRSIYGAGRITVSLEPNPEKGYALSVANDGPDLPEGFDPAACKGLGMRIIRSLVERISGELRADWSKRHEPRPAIYGAVLLIVYKSGVDRFR
jgi:hypothetical protein